MNQTLTVDVTPEPGVVETWNWGENLTAFWPVRGADGTMRFVPTMPANDGQDGVMAIVPARRNGTEVIIVPDRAKDAPGLFQHQIGTVENVGIRWMAIRQNPLRASMANLVTGINRQAGRHRAEGIRQQVAEQVQWFLNLAQLPPMAIFTAIISLHDGGSGGAVTFAGKPFMASYVGGNGVLTNPNESFLNGAWATTQVADDLVQLARKANQVQAATIPCFTPERTRISAQQAWFGIMQQADARARQFIGDSLPSWMPIPHTAPSVAPGMDNIYHVARLIQAHTLPEPSRKVGGCHQVLYLA
jgi:hypothetical protein